MASNFINNLSNTYRGSPSLQNQFATEQDYLDLFDNNQVTPAMAQAYVPVDDTTGIKSIVNTATPIINQSGNDNDGPPGPTGFNRDDNLGTSDYQGTDDGTPAGGIAGTGITGKGLMAALSFAMNPIGFFVGRYAKDRYKSYKEKKEKERKEQEEAAKQADIKAKKDLAGLTTQGGGGGIAASGVTGAQASRMGSGSRQAKSGGQKTGGTGRTDGGWGWAKGGFVRGSYFNGGIVSLRRR